MSVHISDSVIFQSSWSTLELRALFDEKAVVKGWVEVLLALAETQAEFGLIPAAAAAELAALYRELEIGTDLLEDARRDFEATNHSLLGLIKALQSRCPAESGECGTAFG